MANSKKDDNAASTWLGVSCLDGETLVRIAINSTNGGMKIDDTSTIGFTPTPEMALYKDENGVGVVKGVSSVDGSVLPLFVNPVTGGVLIAV